MRIGQNRVCLAVGLMLSRIRSHGDRDREDAHTVEGDRVGRQTVVAGGDCIRGEDNRGTFPDIGARILCAAADSKRIAGGEVFGLHGDDDVSAVCAVIEFFAAADDLKVILVQFLRRDCQRIGCRGLGILAGHHRRGGGDNRRADAVQRNLTGACINRRDGRVAAGVDQRAVVNRAVFVGVILCTERERRAAVGLCALRLAILELHILRSALHNGDDDASGLAALYVIAVRTVKLKFPVQGCRACRAECRVSVHLGRAAAVGVPFEGVPALLVVYAGPLDIERADVVERKEDGTALDDALLIPRCRDVHTVVYRQDGEGPVGVSQRDAVPV